VKLSIPAALCAIALMMAGMAVAQEPFPSKPVRIVVPFPPGGSADVIARDVAAQLNGKWHVPVVVENKPGAGAQIGTDFVAKSAPDGYTLLLTTTHHAINPSLQKKLPYDPRKDFIPLALMGYVVNAVVVSPNFPAANLAQLVDMARAQPGKISFGSTGIGGSTHLAGELLKSMAGIDMAHVPYKGGPQALADLMGGQIPVHFDTINNLLTLHAAGRIRVLAVTSATRSPFLPNVPTVAEAAGLPNYHATGWYAMFSPANVPAPVVATASSAIIEVVRSETMKKRFASHGTDPGDMTQQQFSTFFVQETNKWAEIIKKANIRLD